jgi:hypothetical protein
MALQAYYVALQQLQGQFFCPYQRATILAADQSVLAKATYAQRKPATLRYQAAHIKQT